MDRLFRWDQSSNAKGRSDGRRSGLYSLCLRVLFQVPQGSTGLRWPASDVQRLRKQDPRSVRLLGLRGIIFRARRRDDSGSYQSASTRKNASPVGRSGGRQRQVDVQGMRVVGVPVDRLALVDRHHVRMFVEHRKYRSASERGSYSSRRSRTQRLAFDRHLGSNLVLPMARRRRLRVRHKKELTSESIRSIHARPLPVVGVSPILLAI